MSHKTTLPLALHRLRDGEGYWHTRKLDRDGLLGAEFIHSASTANLPTVYLDTCQVNLVKEYITKLNFTYEQALCSVLPINYFEEVPDGYSG